jgi:tRNA (uracil-5-)-methyltransferase
VAVVDPPRAGLHKTVLRALRGCAALRRIVYVACNPQSLANDAAQLCKPARAAGAGAFGGPAASAPA